MDFARVRELYHEFCELEESELSQALDGLDESPEVLRELASLLGREIQSSALQDGQDVAPAIVREMLAAEVPAATPTKMPETIAGYRIEGILGRGGMGVVYRGRQERPSREVAIKVLHAFENRPDLLRRFEYEGEILGQLDHPNVANVLEAGTDPNNNDAPYLVMELVEGVDLLTYCESNRLTLEDCVRLLGTICQGVEHAHQHGIVHRDLKPTNILVSADGRPRILDFGIARPVLDEDNSTPGQTQAGAILGSLAWMSPEQARGDVSAMDLRTDVYSLGVILYRVLTGRMPHEVAERTPWEVARQISEEDPTRMGDIRATLRGDLEAIVTMALEKDPARRYSSAGMLGRDLERFLNLQPVDARGWSATYQLQKFARRHRALVGAAALLFLSVLVGMIVSISLWRKTETARGEATAEAARAGRAEVAAVLQAERAEAEARTNDHVVTFLTNMFEQAAAFRPGKEEVTVREVLDGSVMRIQTDFAEEPLVRARLQTSMGSAYGALGLLERSESLLAGALETTREEHEGLNSAYYRARYQWAILLARQTKYAESQEVLKECIAWFTETTGPTSNVTLEARLRMLRGQLWESSARPEDLEAMEQELLELLASHRESSPQGSGSTYHTLTTLSDVNVKLLRPEQAKAHSLEALKGLERLLGPGHPDTLRTRCSLAMIAKSQGDLQLAREYLEEGLRLARDKISDQHPQTISLLLDLGVIQIAAGDLEQADATLTEAVQLADEVLGPKNLEALRARFYLASVYRDQGRLDETAALYELILSGERERLGSDSPNTIETLYNLASLNGQRGRLDLAEEGFQEVVQRYTGLFGECAKKTLHAVRMLSRVHAGQEAWDKFDQLAEHVETCRAELGDGNSALLELWGWRAIDSHQRPATPECVQDLEGLLSALVNAQGERGAMTVNIMEVLVLRFLELKDGERALDQALRLVELTDPDSPDFERREEQLIRAEALRNESDQ